MRSFENDLDGIHQSELCHWSSRFPRMKGSVRAEFIKAVIATVALVLLTVKQLVVRSPYGEGSVFLGVAAPVTALLTAIAAVKLYQDMRKQKT